jgi:hypothetical protein
MGCLQHLLLLLLAMGLVSTAADAIIWDAQYINGDITITAGQRVVLRNRTVITGQLMVASGGLLTVDPSASVELQIGNLEIHGAFEIGSAEALYAQKAIVTLGCSSTFPAADDRRNGINVRQGGRMQLFGSKGSLIPWTRLSATAIAGSSRICLSETVDWAIGDTIVITTTDFDPHFTEKRTITAILKQSCLHIDAPLEYMHYGEFAQGIDERAEVGLLSRNIRFQGCLTDPSLGGHLKVWPTNMDDM